MPFDWWTALLFPLVAAAEAAARRRPANLWLAWQAVQLAAYSGNALATGRIARHALECLASSPARLAAVLEEGRRSGPPPRIIDHNRAVEALGDVHARLTSSGLEVFLVFGTLLGAVRDGRFIPGDADLDLGATGTEPLGRIRGALAGGSIRVSRIQRVAGQPSKRNRCSNPTCSSPA